MHTKKVRQMKTIFFGFAVFIARKCHKSSLKISCCGCFFFFFKHLHFNANVPMLNKSPEYSRRIQLVQFDSIVIHVVLLRFSFNLPSYIHPKVIIWATYHLTYSQHYCHSCAVMENQLTAHLTVVMAVIQMIEQVY